MTDRIRCCIVGCGRTYKRNPDWGETYTIMCRRHWRMGEVARLTRHKQLWRRARWFERRWAKRHRAIEADPKLHYRFYRAWRRANQDCSRVWHQIADDVQIKAAFRAEDAPKRRGEL